MKSTRSSDGQAVLDARKELEYAGYGFLADHSNVFRDEDDRTVVTFSPYDAVPKGIDVPGYDVEVSDYSIYSYGTKTILIFDAYEGAIPMCQDQRKNRIMMPHRL